MNYWIAGIVVWVACAVAGYFLAHHTEVTIAKRLWCYGDRAWAIAASVLFAPVSLIVRITRWFIFSLNSYDPARW